MEIAAHAVMALSGNKLHIAYTRKIYDPVAETDVQDIFYANCSIPCDGLSSSDFDTVSGALVEVAGNLPSETIAALATDDLRNSAYIYFLGIDRNISDNEVILGVNSCDGWGNTPFERDFVESSSTFRFIKPSLIAKGGWLHLVYERFEGTNPHEIFYRRAAVTCPATLLLPVIRK
jgi:hypothetical protein